VKTALKTRYFFAPTNSLETLAFTKLVRLGTDGNFTKNALHLAAWKGDQESIKLLVEAGVHHGLDLVNVISTGEGNYGKTRTFITRRHSDAWLNQY
jgi:hypothetical protein